jgi:hypothetical protein
MQKQVCIYCWRTSDNVSFNTEHVIPDALNGRLTLDDYVCEECNSWLGRHVDHQILGIPEILMAQKEYGSNKRYVHARNHKFDIKLLSETGEEFLAHEKQQKPHLLPQKHPVFGMMHPESSMRESLQKNLQRKLGTKDLTNKEQQEIDRVCKMTSGSKIYSPIFGSFFSKHTEKFRTVFSPKSKPIVEPLIAKIAYEFIFIVAYKKLFTTEDLAARLLSAIYRTEPSKTFIYRAKSRFESPQPFHFIRLYNHGGYIRFDVGFYGTIHYVLFTPIKMPDDFFQDINAKYDFQKIIGIQYEHDLSNSSQGVWAVDATGTMRPLTAHEGGKGSARGKGPANES